MYRVSIMSQLANTCCYGYVLLWLLLCMQAINLFNRDNSDDRFPVHLYQC